MSKKLVAYFSASGVTAQVAKALASAINADLLEIKPQTPYTDADLNWHDKHSRTSIEMDDPSSRPAIAGNAPELAGYGTVFIGFPIWWYTAPTLIKTFLEACRFSGQTVALFATSHSSGMGDTVKTLAPCCPGATIRDGRMLNGHPTAEELRAWAASVEPKA